MAELNYVKFRKLSVSLFLCFPNVRRISLSFKSNHSYIDLWKNVNIEKYDGVWINSSSTSMFYDRINTVQSKIGLFGRIPLYFLGYNSVDCSFPDIIDRKSLRINENQISTNDVNCLKEKINKIFNYSNLKSITFEKFGKLKLKNSNEQTFEISMRGSGIRTNIRSEITKSC